MKLPEPVEISPALHRRLLDANDSLQTVQQMIRLFTNQCEAKMREAQDSARGAWGEIARSTGIDIETVQWEPHPTEAKIVPTAVRLVSKR